MTQSLNVLKSLLGEKNYYRMMKVCEVGATAASLLTDLEAVHKENLIRSGEMETEATGIKTMDDSTGIKPAELSEGIPEEIKSVQMPELPKNTGVRAAATGQVENEAGVAATGLVENNTVPGLKSVDNKLSEGIRTQIAETEIPRAKAVGENISGRNPLERKTPKIEPVRTKLVNEILPNRPVTGEMSGGGGKASDLPIIEKGTKEWEEAVKNIANGETTSYRTRTATEAKELLNEARGNMNRYKQYTFKKYKKGYEIHPNEINTRNAPHNDLPHVKWKDWLDELHSGKGHIFFNKPN